MHFEPVARGSNSAGVAQTAIWRVDQDLAVLRSRRSAAAPTSLASPPIVGRAASVAGDQLHGFGPRGRVAKLAAYGAGNGLRARLADTPHGHAQVLALDHHDDTPWLQNALQSLRHLGGQPLLDLRALRVDVDQPGQLRQSGDPAVDVRDVTHVSHSGERHQMMLATTPDLDVLDQHEFVMADVEKRRQHRLGLFSQAMEHLRVRPRDPPRSVPQPVPLGILANTDQDLPDRGDYAILIEGAGRAGPSDRVHTGHPPAVRHTKSGPAGRS